MFSLKDSSINAPIAARLVLTPLTLLVNTLNAFLATTGKLSSQEAATLARELTLELAAKVI